MEGHLTTDQETGVRLPQRVQRNASTHSFCAIYRKTLSLMNFLKTFESFDSESGNKHIISLHGDGVKLRFMIQKDHVIVYQQHPSLGNVKWFGVDKEGNFEQYTTATELWVVKVLKRVFDKTKTEHNVEEILQNPSFSKWWKDVLYKNRGRLGAEKFGFYESSNFTMSAEEIADYIKSLTPRDSDHPDYFISLILKSKKKFHLETVKIEDLLKKDDSLREYVESGEVRYGEDGESDIEPHPDDLFNPIVVFEGEVVDGYSRTSTLYHSGEKTIQAWVSE